MAIIGYGRVSTIDQSLDLKVEKLKEYGCEIFLVALCVKKVFNLVV
nr:hypothetical protein [Peribacillus frigoritolerans]